MRVFVFTAVFFLSPFLSVSAQAVNPQQNIERAQICIDALDFECAQQELSKARPLSKGLNILNQRKLFELGAITALSLGKLAQAEDELRKLLDLVPRFRPQEGSWPPNWLNVLKRVRLGMPDKEPPRIQEPTHLEEGYIGHDWALKVRVLDESGVAGVTLFLSLGGELKKITMRTSGGEGWEGVVPGSWLRATSISYWIEAFDRAGNGPSKLGSIDTPFQLELRAKPIVLNQPIYEKWWFWTALAGVAAVGGTTYFLMSGSAESSSLNPTGKLNVEIEWPSP
jgi:hypothetical protein